MKESFVLQCENILLTKSERQYLLKWGEKLENLELGKIEPKRQMKRVFVNALKKKDKPFSYREKLWFKYIVAKEWSISNKDTEWESTIMKKN